jgi:hypothetical protein
MTAALALAPAALIAARHYQRSCDRRHNTGEQKCDGASAQLAGKNACSHDPVPQLQSQVAPCLFASIKRKEGGHFFGQSVKHAVAGAEGP